MIAVGNTIISDQVANVKFVCDLQACKGACCIEGDVGAPLEEDEIGLLEDALDEIAPFMAPAGLEVVDRTGVFEYDAAGAYVTPLVNGRECAFVVTTGDGIASCAIEQAWQAGRINFRKPVSCHLYPVRITAYADFDAVNYHEWHICRPALRLGNSEGVPLYVFLKDSLTRRYGEAWYEALCREIEQ